MRSQRTLQGGEHYPNQVQERTKKDKLFNDLLLSILKAKELCLNHDEVHTFGVRLLKTICDVLWYIDGSHHLFSQRSTGIPQIFHTFTGYNVPEKSKHRKRVTDNVSPDRLIQLSKELVAILQHNQWTREKWRVLKPDVLGLAQSVAGYAECLASKNKAMKLNHMSSVPVREISENIRIHYQIYNRFTTTLFGIN